MGKRILAVGQLYGPIDGDRLRETVWTEDGNIVFSTHIVPLTAYQRATLDIEEDIRRNVDADEGWGYLDGEILE